MSHVEESFDDFGKYVVQQSKSNLTKYGKRFKDVLYDSLGYEIKEMKNSISWTFHMEYYGNMVDKGVRGAGGVRKTTSQFKKTNNKGKLWKIKGKNSPYKFGKSGGISPKHFTEWADSKGISPFAVAKSVYHQGLETTNFFTRPIELGMKRLPDEILEAYALDFEDLIKNS